MPKYVPLKPGIKGKGPHLHILIKQEVIYKGKIIRFLSSFFDGNFFHARRKWNNTYQEFKEKNYDTKSFITRENDF